MRKTFAVLAAAVAALALASMADAAGKAKGEIVFYDSALLSPDKAVVFGQLFSSGKCVGKRDFGLVVTKANGKKTTVDSGRTSAEGGISGFVTIDEFPSGAKLGFVVAETEKCAKVKLTLEGGEMRGAGSPGRAAPATVEVLDVDGDGPDGAVGGVVTSSKSKCVESRKLKLKVNGKTTDRGTTTEDGTFALHIKAREFTPENDIAIAMSKSKGCAAGVGLVPSPT